MPPYSASRKEHEENKGFPRKEVVVISLGGSLIIQDEVNVKFLNEFKKVLNENKNKYKFVIVCGGGKTARKYISALKNKTLQSYIGISATRMNARLISYIFGIDQKEIPHTFENVKKHLETENFVFCGALEYKEDQTSDSTSAEIAKKLNARFINMTNVKGLYTKDPNKLKDAKLITDITYEEFDKIIQKIKYQPGQHFVLDQKASKIIMQNQIPTFIIKEPKELNNILKNKKFIGTIIK